MKYIIDIIIYLKNELETLISNIDNLSILEKGINIITGIV